MKKWKLVIATSALLVGAGAGLAGASTAKEAHRAKLVAKFDTNKDGKLDRAERTVMKDARAAKAFARLDADGDGKLSLEEFKAGRMHAHHRRGAKRL